MKYRLNVKKNIGINKPLVSVIIAAYNCENTLEKCVKSIVYQTYDNIEIIICDDCSCDGTRELMKKIKSEYNNVQILFNETNQKSAKTRNNCVEVSKGKYICIQDSDDFSDKHRIEVEVEFLEKNQKYSYVTTGAFIERYGKTIGEICFPEKELEDRDFIKNLPLIHASMMIKKEVFSTIGGYRDLKRTRRIEDYDLFMRLQAQNYYGYNIKKSYYHYLSNDDTFKRRKFRYAVDAVKVKYEDFKELDIRKRDYIYVLRPLVVGIIPIWLQKYIKVLTIKKRFKGK